MKETEQTLLDQIQNDVAEEKVHVLWEDLTPIGRSRCWPIVCERYAEAKAKASCEATLKRVLENLEFDEVVHPPNNDREIVVRKESVLSPSNIVIV